MIQIGAKGTLKRLDEMLESAMNGTFDETSYDETELSRLESRWKQYFTAQGQLVGQVKKERENIRTLVSDISHQTKTPLANILLYAELLDEKAENEEEKMLAGQIVWLKRMLLIAQPFLFPERITLHRQFLSCKK